MSNPATKIEILYPEYGNQGGDNGNALYLEACLPKENFVYTSHAATPYFVEHTPSAIIMGGMTEAQQELIISRLMPYKDRLAELADQGVPMLFAGNASELFGEKIVNPDGSEIEALGLFKFTTTRYMPQRFHDVQVGEFDPGNGKEPFVVVGFKMQFTLTEGDNSNCLFFKSKRGVFLACHIQNPPCEIRIERKQWSNKPGGNSVLATETFQLAFFIDAKTYLIFKEVAVREPPVASIGSTTRQVRFSMSAGNLQ